MTVSAFLIAPLCPVSIHTQSTQAADGRLLHASSKLPIAQIHFKVIESANLCLSAGELQRCRDCVTGGSPNKTNHVEAKVMQLKQRPVCSIARVTAEDASVALTGHQHTFHVSTRRWFGQKRCLMKHTNI